MTGMTRMNCVCTGAAVLQFWGYWTSGMCAGVQMWYVGETCAGSGQRSYWQICHPPAAMKSCISITLHYCVAGARAITRVERRVHVIEVIHMAIPIGIHQLECCRGRWEPTVIDWCTNQDHAEGAMPGIVMGQSPDLVVILEAAGCSI